MKVFRSDPTQRGFSQPCPLWNGDCTIHDSANYPHSCRAYNCKLLKAVLAETISLPNALTLVVNAKQMIHDVARFLPQSTIVNFRERLVAHLNELQAAGLLASADEEFKRQAAALLSFYEEHFGVIDIVDPTEDKPG